MQAWESTTHSCQVPIHAKVIKATTLQFALMKGTYSYRPRDLWLCDILINEERHIETFTKALGHQIWKTKNIEWNIFIRFKDEMINAVSWNKLKLVSCKGILNSSRILSLYLWFLTKEVVLQICRCVHGRKFHLIFLDDITRWYHLDDITRKLKFNQN